MSAGPRLYPSQWERHIVLGDDWQIFVRPLKPNDEGLIRDLLVHVSKEDLRLRFFDSIKKFSPHFIASLTHLDYARAMAFVAIDGASNETLGVVRLLLTRPTSPVSTRSCCGRISRAEDWAGP